MKILLFKQGSLGDVLCITPLVSLLKKNYPDIQIDFLTSKSCSVLIENNIAISRILKIEELMTSKSIFKEACRIFKFFISLLKNRSYDKVFVFHRSILINSIMRVAMGNKIYSFGENLLSKLILKGCIPFNLKEPRILRHINMIKKAFPILTYTEQDLSLEYYVNKRKENEFSHLQKPYIVIAPCGGRNFWSEMPNRKWPLAKYINLAKKIINIYNFRIVFIGDNYEKSEITNALKINRENKFINLSGQLDIEQLASLLNSATLFIGNDSFPLFLAAAVGTKTIGIFGPTDSDLINPYGKNHVAVQSEVICSPCYNPIDSIRGKAYLCATTNCMNNITVDAIFSQARILIES